MVNFNHVLAILAPFYGHNYPLLLLCCKLASRNCCKRVTAIVPQQGLDTVDRLRSELEANGEIECGTIILHALPVSMPPDVAVPADSDEQVQSLATFLQDTCFTATRDLLGHLAFSTPVSCVLSDHQLGWGQDIANIIGVPRLCLCIAGGLSELALNAHIAEGRYNPFEGTSEPVEVPGYVPSLQSDIPRILRRHPDVGHWTYNQEQFRRAKEAALILVNSFYAFEGKAYDYLLQSGLPIKLIGPLLPSKPASFAADEENCLAWLDRQPPESVLYASLGTLAAINPAHLLEIFSGIEESGQRFLISCRMEMVSGNDELKSFWQRYSEQDNLRGKVVSWAPQVRVLNHPSVVAFFTHYGLNTIFEAIAAGVPMLGKPLVGDHLILRRHAINQHKIAIDIAEDAENRTMVAKAVTQLVKQGNEQRANILRLRDSLLKAVNTGGTSFTCLDELAKQSSV